MKFLQEWFKHTGSLHHAYLIQGEAEAIRSKLFTFFNRTLEFPTQGNPDFEHQTFDVLSIDDARALQEKQTTRPIAHPIRLFVLETRGMTVEAQNALLKMFEEPALEVHFFLIMPSADVLLPTLRSRLQIISDDERSEKGKSRAKTFLGLSVPERLTYVAPIIEEKDKAAACELLDGVLIEITRKKNTIHPSLVHELLTLRAYLNDRAPSLKLILEQCAILVP